MLSRILNSRMRKQRTLNVKWKHITWIIKCHKNTLSHTVVYKTEEGSSESMYVAYCDAAFASEIESKSRIAHVFFVLGCLVNCHKGTH